MPSHPIPSIAAATATRALPPCPIRACNGGIASYLSIYPSIHLSIYPSIHPPIHPSIHPPTHPSTSLSSLSSSHVCTHSLLDQPRQPKYEQRHTNGAPAAPLPRWARLGAAATQQDRDFPLSCPLTAPAVVHISSWRIISNSGGGFLHAARLGSVLGRLDHDRAFRG